MKADNNEEMLINDSLQNTTTAVLLLREWLSISESQICSAEVLSEQLPKVNSLLETSMNDISTHFGNIAKSSDEIEQEISHISSAVDIIEMDGEKISIPEYIESLATTTSDKDTAKKALKLLSAIKSQERSIFGEIKKVKKAIEANVSEMSKIVVGMQFQDRVSQNIMITINIMRTISDYLDKEIANSLPSVSKEERKKMLNKEFAKDLLQKFRLGELQSAFVEHLVKHGYITDASEIGFSPKDHNKTAEDVELF